MKRSADRPPDDAGRPPPGRATRLDPLAPFDGEGWIAVAREAERTRGAAIGGYEIVEEVRTGAQGLVLRARQPNTGRDVALKRLAGGTLSSARARHRFEREVDLVGRLDHPGIVTMYGVEVIDGVPLLAMEWVDGVDFATWSAGLGGGATPGRRLRTFLTLCDAVAHAHGRGVIHRDLKPDNVLVDADGRCHVLDFGLARRVTPAGSSGTSRTVGFVGTPAYAPPESFTIGAAPIDARGDVYSLGVLLYELLTGRLPFREDSIHAVATDKERSAARPPSRLAPEISRELDTIVTTAMAREPEARYPTVDALAEDVRRHLDGRPVLAVPPSALYVVGKWVRRNRAVAALLAAVVLLVVAALGVSLTLARALADERDRADAARRTAESAARDARREQATAERARDALGAALAEARAHERRTRDVQDAYLDAVFLAGKAHPTGRETPLADVIVEVHRLANERLGDARDLQAEILARVATFHLASGDLDAAERIASSALATRRDVGSAAPGTTAQLLGVLTNVHAARSEPEAALATAEEAVAVLGRLPDRSELPRTRCLAELAFGWFRAELGDPDSGLRSLVEAARVATEERLPPTFLLQVEDFQARVLLGCGRAAEAVAVARSALVRAASLPPDADVLPAVASLQRTLSAGWFAVGDLACGAEAHRLRVETERAAATTEKEALRDDTFRAGFHLLENGAAAEGLRMFRLLLTLGPEGDAELAARRGVAECLVRLGDHRRAAPLYDELLERTRPTGPVMDPGRLDLQVRAAACRAALGDRARVRELVADCLHQIERGLSAGVPPHPRTLERLTRLADRIGFGESMREELEALGLPTR